MVTVNSTVKKELNTADEILDYLVESTKNDVFEAGDKVSLVDRGGVGPNSVIGDVAVVVGYEFPGSPFTIVRSLHINGAVVNIMIPTQNLQAYQGTPTNG